jgi:3-keto-disaccharide hydrolase/FG-GAP-like repeat
MRVRESRMTKERVTMLLVAVALAAPVVAPVFGAGPSFVPDARFQGSTLTGWRTLGDAAWRAENGEIVGTPTQAHGGWLVLDRSYQDTGFFASFLCNGGCKPGVLLRAEKTPDGGMKGVYVSLAEGDVAPYAVKLDAQGRETGRDRLRTPGGGQVRIAPPVDPAAAAARGGAGGRAGVPDGAARAGGPAAQAGRGGDGPAVTLPVPPARTGLRPGEWNDAEILLDANIVRVFVNNGGPSGVADDEAGRYGPLALYVGGSGEVRFKNVAWKDLAMKSRPAEQVSSRFRMQRLSDFYYGWGASADDFNHDGVLDVVAGPHIFFGPDYTKSREIYLALTTNPSNAFTTDCWMQYSADFTGDGWADVINASFSGANSGVTLYVNPKGETRRWDSYRVVPSQQTEIAVLSDLDGDGKPEFVYGAQGAMRYARPDPANPTAAWIVRAVSETGYATAHGVGVGDVNGDKRPDILNAYGWWEQPPATSAQELWTYHPQAFGRAAGRTSAGGSVMAVYDANGDGRNDVVTSLSAHGWGLAWFEQKRDASGAISFVQHMIMDDYGTRNAGGVTFSQLHGTGQADVDGDGVQDFIAGKRYWSHQDTQIDPDAYGDPVLYWYRTVRNPKAPGGAEFVPELIHNRSGAGSHVIAVDVNRDKRIDIITPTKFGTFIFWGK